MNSMTNGSADAAPPMNEDRVIDPLQERDYFPPEIKLSKWQITRTTSLVETIIVEASDRSGAFQKARKASDDEWEVEDRDSDYTYCELIGE